MGIMVARERSNLERAHSCRFTSSLFYRLMAPTMSALMESSLRRWLNDAERTLDGTGVQPEMQVLEIGCGTGYFTLHAARRIGTAGHLHSIDLSPESIDLVSHKIDASGLKNTSLSVADAIATRLPSEIYDTILLLGVIPAPKLPLSELLPEMHRLLKANGRLAVWPAAPLFLRPAIEKRGLFTFESKVNGVFRFRKIDE